MVRSRPQEWDKRKLLPEAYECDRLYVDAIADEIMSGIPHAASFDPEINRKLLRSVVCALEIDLIWLSRPKAGNKRAALKLLREKLQNFCAEFESIDDHSRKEIIEAARADENDYAIDYSASSLLDKGYTRIGGLSDLSRSGLKWIDAAILALHEDHTGGKRKLEPERFAVAKLEVIWRSFNPSNPPKEAELTSLSRAALTPILNAYDKEFPKSEKIVEDVLQSAEWLHWPDKKAFQKFVKEIRRGTNGVRRSRTPLGKPLAVSSVPCILVSMNNSA